GLITRATNQPCAYDGESAANHMSQSRRRWYGATCRGRRCTSPGLPLKAYSFHSVAGVITASPVPASTTSLRTRVTLPKAPYVFMRCRELKLAFMSCRRDAMLRMGQKLR